MESYHETTCFTSNTVNEMSNIPLSCLEYVPNSKNQKPDKNFSCMQAILIILCEINLQFHVGHLQFRLSCQKIEGFNEN